MHTLLHLTLLSLIPLTLAAKPTSLEFLSTTLRQCDDLTASVTATKPGESIDIVYKPKDNSSATKFPLAAIGPGISETSAERHCYLSFTFRLHYSDVYEAEQMRIGAVDVEVGKVELESGVEGSLTSFLTWGNVRQDFTPAIHTGPFVEEGVKTHHTNVTKPQDAFCRYFEPIENTLQVWNYFTLKGNGTDVKGSMSGEAKVSLKFAWKARCTYPGDDGDKIKQDMDDRAND